MEEIPEYNIQNISDYEQMNECKLQYGEKGNTIVESILI